MNKNLINPKINQYYFAFSNNNNQQASEQTHVQACLDLKLINTHIWLMVRKLQ